MHCRFDSSIFILQLTVLMLSAKWPGEKIRYCDVHIQLTRLQNCYRLNPHKIGGGAEKKIKTEKKQPAGNRMHMAPRRMTGWIQEMGRKAEEGEVLDRSCARIKKFLF